MILLEKRFTDDDKEILDATASRSNFRQPELKVMQQNQSGGLFQLLKYSCFSVSEHCRNE